MVTTYSEPKEMLGYIVVKFIDQQLPILMNVPYDKRSVFAFYYQLRGLDSQLVSFRKDMFILEGEKKYDYFEVMEEINNTIQTQWNYVFGKDYDTFMKALFKWSELIASCYPKLGLVPESKQIIQAENIVNEEPEEEVPYETGAEYGDRPSREPEPEQPTTREVEVDKPINKPKQGFRFL